MNLIRPVDLESAIGDLSMCEFFPHDPATQAAIMRLLAAMCPHREALQWLVAEMTNRIGKWHGPTELRAVLCTHWRPADGIERLSTLSGYRPEDSESVVYEQHQQITAGGWGESEAPRLERVVDMRRLAARRSI